MLRKVAKPETPKPRTVLLLGVRPPRLNPPDSHSILVFRAPRRPQCHLLGSSCIGLWSCLQALSHSKDEFLRTLGQGCRHANSQTPSDVFTHR